VSIIVCLGLLAACQTHQVHAEPVRSWAYQLQNYDATALRAAEVDLLVVDIDELSASDITVDELKERNRNVISYLSIGEAENYRRYWTESWDTTRPSFLATENPNWVGNFRVRYWHPDWIALMRNAVERIARAGYDGVYLDTIDTYVYFEQQGVTDARGAMIRLVLDLAKTARKIRPDFKVIAQNAAQLTANSDYLKAIDGLASEDTFFDGDFPQPHEQVASVLAHLNDIRFAGKTVLTVEYSTAFSAIRRSCKRSELLDFVPLIAPRKLNRLDTRPHRNCRKAGVGVAAVPAP